MVTEREAWHQQICLWSSILCYFKNYYKNCNVLLAISKLWINLFLVSYVHKDVHGWNHSKILLSTTKDMFLLKWLHVVTSQPIHNEKFELHCSVSCLIKTSPGLLMYMCTGSLLLSDCRNRSWATTRLDMSSWICRETT